MKVFRKPYLSILMTGLILFMSCESNNEPRVLFDAQALKKTHQKISSSLNSELNYLHSSSVSGRVLTDSESEQLLIENLNHINKYGLEFMLEENGIDPEILQEFAFYQENKADNSVYELLSKRFIFETQLEVDALFQLVELHSLIQSELLKKSARVKAQIDWGCVLAIAGAIIATAGGAFVTGGASLIIFLASKGIALASIIEACKPKE